MNNTDFIEYCRTELITSFTNTKNSKQDDKQKHRTEGLLHAARLLEIIDKDALNKLIEREHINVFGETVESRKARKQSLDELKASSPDDYFAIPAITRKQGKL